MPDANTLMSDGPTAGHMSIASVHWERIQIHLHGRCAQRRTEDDSGCAFYLENTRTCERVPVVHTTCSDESIAMRVNVMQARGGYPLETGTWALFAGDLRDEPAPTALDTDDASGAYGCAPERVGRPVRMDAALRIDPATYGGLFTNRGNRYWVLPVADATTHQFALDVSYRPRPPRRRRSLIRRGISLKRASRKARTRLFMWSYKTCRALVPRNGHRILFTSDSRADLSGNLLCVHERMCERGLDKTHKLLTIFKPSVAAKRPLLDKLRFPFYLGIADVVLMDDYQPMIYKVRYPADVKLIQLWHASGAFKTVGYSRVGKPGGPMPYSKHHRIYTHAIVSSKHDVPFYAEAFGIAEDNVHPTGIPRMDTFFDEDAIAAARERAYEAVPAARGRRVILFAPTFRGAGPLDAHYDYSLIDLGALHAVCAEQDAIVIFKMHPFIDERIDIPSEFADRLLDATELREVNDLLMISDVVITDYSSLVFEYSTLGRPMLFFAYDLEEYEAERDFYEDLTSFAPGKIVRTFSELIQSLRDGDFEQHKVEEFARRHFDHLNAGSTDRVIDDLILG